MSANNFNLSSTASQGLQDSDRNLSRLEDSALRKEPVFSLEEFRTLPSLEKGWQPDDIEPAKRLLLIIAATLIVGLSIGTTVNLIDALARLATTASGI